MMNVSVDLEGSAEKEFHALKEKLTFRNNTEVVRWALSFANKKFPGGML